MKHLFSIILSTITVMLLTPMISAKQYDFPSHTNVHLYMDYGCITNTSSNQYKFEKYCKTDSNGLRYYLDEIGRKYYVVAMSEYYSTDIGSAFYVSLDNDSSFYVVLGDCKDPSDTDNKYGRACWNFIDQTDCTNVLEFIVDTDELPKKVRNWGTVTALDFFNGNIDEIESMGRVWYPDDEYSYHC